MKRKAADFLKYFVEFPRYLVRIEHFSERTKDTYREATILLLYFMEQAKKINRNDLSISDIDKVTIIEFLDWLVNEKKCQPNTRNNRRSGILKFFEFVSSQNIEYSFTSQKIHEIKMLKTRNRVMRYLEFDEIELLMNQFDRSTAQGRRHYTIILLLYSSAMRVQELIDLKLSSIRANTEPTLEIIGKGSKPRFVPITSIVFERLDKYLKENLATRKSLKEFDGMDRPIFVNSRGEKLTREGINHILKKHLVLAKQKKPTLNICGISCHSLRHSKATHWLEEGMPMLYLSLLLGHNEATTTSIYGHVTMKQKRQAFEKANKDLASEEVPKWGNGLDVVFLTRKF